MQMIDEETGKKIILDPTPELLADLAPLNEECNHPRKEPRQKRIRGGALQYVDQCLDCGRTVSSPHKHSPDLGKAPQWCYQTQNNYETDRERRRNLIYRKHARIQRERIQGFWKVYNVYLKSREWHEKRERVLRRANGQCEGCGSKRATQVHHLTYANFRKEFLFELVAVCTDCHERLHDSQEEQLHHRDFESVETVRPCDGCRYESEENGKPVV